MYEGNLEPVILIRSRSRQSAQTDSALGNVSQVIEASEPDADVRPLENELRTRFSLEPPGAQSVHQTASALRSAYTAQRGAETRGGQWENRQSRETEKLGCAGTLHAAAERAALPRACNTSPVHNENRRSLQALVRLCRPRQERSHS